LSEALGPYRVQSSATREDVPREWRLTGPGLDLRGFRFPESRERLEDLAKLMNLAFAAGIVAGAARVRPK
jgi:hypothetical protein